MRYYFPAIILIFLLTAASINAQKIYDLKTFTVSSVKTADTVFGTWKFSVADYEFNEDKLVLLTYKKSLLHAKLMLADPSQKILSSIELPDEAVKLYKDYLGFINVICIAHIYRITIIKEKITLASLPVEDYKRFVMPCIDTLQKDIYFSNYQKNYPEFTYYAYNTADSSLSSFRTVCDKDALKGYNMEYYFLKPRERVDALKLASYYGVDKHRIAAAMSGLTSSMFYTPLYAPLLVMRDTVYVFDHYSDAIFTYDHQHRLLDSVHIDYNHPKNWREWKHTIIADKESNEVYALYEKNGFYYLKHIDLRSGKINGSYKFSNQYVDNIKIKNGYVYYVYSPFESLQEFFVYKELIKNN